MRDDFDNRRDEFDVKLPERDYNDQIDDRHRSPEGVELDQLDPQRENQSDSDDNKDEDQDEDSDKDARK